MARRSPQAREKISRRGDFRRARQVPDFNAINNLPPNSDPDIARDAGQLKNVLTKCAIGATEFKGKFSRALLERMVKRDLGTRSRRTRSTASTCAMMCRDRTSRHTAAGAAPRLRGRSPRPPTTRTAAGWPRCSPAGGCVSPRSSTSGLVASVRLSAETERQSWRHHSVITERNGHQSDFHPGKVGRAAHPPFGC